jgi:monosaccharide-transporting ATPase
MRKPHCLTANIKPENIMSVLLDIRGVSKSFPGVKALDDVNFTAHSGEIHALLGENGAGKSTLIKALTGVYKRDAGKVLFAGEEIFPKSPSEAEGLGISTVYQEVNLVPTLSVAENIMLGRQPMACGFIQWKQLRKQAEESLARLDLAHIDVSRRLGSYSVAIQQMVAIARALDVNAKLLILDEPTASLDDKEVDELFSLMRTLKKQGMGMIFVTHFIDQVYSICDRITVLRNGTLAGDWPIAELPHLKLVAEMLGKAPGEVAELEKKHVSQAERSEIPLIKLEQTGRKGAVRPLDLEIFKGETLGLAGLLGSGRTEIARMLFGIDPADSGSLMINGRNETLSDARKAIRHKFAFISEDRKIEGIIPSLSIRENIILALQAKKGMINQLSRTAQRDLAGHYFKALRIKAPSIETAVGTLSGGNQQKVLIARWLTTQPEFIIFDEPTRGIDIGAKSEVELIVEDLRQKGCAVLLISSEIEEIVRNSQRIIVLRDRRKITELDGTRVDTHDVMCAIASTTSVDSEVIG